MLCLLLFSTYNLWYSKQQLAEWAMNWEDRPGLSCGLQPLILLTEAFSPTTIQESGILHR